MEKKTDVFLTITECPTCMRCSPMGELKCENEASGWKQASGFNAKKNFDMKLRLEVVGV